MNRVLLKLPILDYIPVLAGFAEGNWSARKIAQKGGQTPRNGAGEFGVHKIGGQTPFCATLEAGMECR